MESGSEDTFVVLDNGQDRDAAILVFSTFREIIRAVDPIEVHDAIARLEYARSQGHYAVGFFSYELGYLLEQRLSPLLPKHREVPLLWFAICDQPAILDQASFEKWLSDRTSGAGHIKMAGLSIDEQEYLARFARVMKWIEAGDVYQLNLTFKARFQFSGDITSLYRHLRQRQRVAHGALIRTPDFSIVCSSPELFMAINDDKIETRPMKGTAARVPAAGEDENVVSWLANDPKSRAENLMIVDLMRNDLGKIARIGSVQVPSLFEVETYSTLHQMISRIQAELVGNVGISELIRAIFPPGSVTGAPKIRAMELIRELEDEPRGVYTGAIGMFAPNGRADFNVAIRTAVIFPDGRGEIGIGSGLVADSEGRAEFAECLLKMKFLDRADTDFQLIETLRYSPSEGYRLLDEHMSRLMRSAGELDFLIDKSAVYEALAVAVESRKETCLRVRLLLFKDGSLETAASAMDPPNTKAPIRYTISHHRVCSTDPLLYHKTTSRKLYDEEALHLSKALGVDEVVFVNEHGELTEGSRTNIFLERDGCLQTPRVECGLLPGTLRSALVASGRAVEASLTPADLDAGNPVFLGNSVRELQPALQVRNTT